MKFAKYTFLTAGIYGLLALVPQYLLENKFGADTSPAITHPEFFYGFVGVGIAFQIVFLIIARDPEKYRLLILPSIVEKFSFGLAITILFLTARTGAHIMLAASIDLILGALFIICWFKLTPKPDIPNVSESIN